MEKATPRSLAEKEYRPLFGFLFPLCGHDHEMTADICQEVFAHVISRFSNFEWNTPQKILRKIGHDFLVNRMRRENHYREITLKTKKLLLNLDTVNINESEIEIGELRKQIETILSFIPENCRIALLLRYGQNLPVAEIADKLMVNYKSAENLIAKAKHIFQKTAATYGKGDWNDVIESFG